MRTEVRTEIRSLFVVAAVALSVAAPLQARGLRAHSFRLSQAAADRPQEVKGPGGPASHSEEINGPDGRPMSPELKAAELRAGQLNDEGNVLLSNGQYAAAEATFREALALWPDRGTPYAGLAEALDAQGREQDALAAYRTLFDRFAMLDSAVNETRTKMGYAIALSRAGQWAEAVAVYEKALPDSDGYFGPKIDTHFDPRVPMPSQLQALAHVASGAQYNGNDPRRAFLHYAQALRLDPDSPFTNTTTTVTDGGRLVPRTRRRSSTPSRPKLPCGRRSSSARAILRRQRRESCGSP